MRHPAQSLTSTGSILEPKLTYRNILDYAVAYYLSEGSSLGWRMQGNKYYAEPNGRFLYLIKDDEHVNSGIRDLNGGLKFHVSIHPDDFEKGLNIVNNILIKYGILESKFPNPFCKDAPHEYQEPGKEICIYAFMEPDRPLLSMESSEKDKVSWDTIIGEITASLHDAKIRPGALAVGASAGGTGEKPISGTNYVSWRNDDPFLRSTNNEALNTARNRQAKYEDTFNTMGRLLLRQRKVSERLDVNNHFNIREHRYQLLRNDNNVPDGFGGKILTEPPKIPSRPSPTVREEPLTTELKRDTPRKKDKHKLSKNTQVSTPISSSQRETHKTNTHSQATPSQSAPPQLRALPYMSELTQRVQKNNMTPNNDQQKRKGPGNIG